MNEKHSNPDKLFKRLKFRFLRINFIAILLVLFVVLFCVYAATTMRTQRQNTLYMKDIIDRAIDGENPFRKNNWRSIDDNDVPPQPASSSDKMSNSMQQFPKNNRNGIRPGVILLQTNSVGTIIKTYNDYQRFTEEDFQEMVYTALSTSKKRFVYNDVSYQKQIKHADDDTIYLAFLDDRGERDTTDILLRVSLIAGVGSFIVAFALSAYLSNKAIQPISDSWARQQAFIADAAHELKTPLAVIRANVDAIEIEPDATVASQQKWLNYIKDEAKDMSQLVEELLFLASSDAQVRPTKQSQTNLSLLCEEVFIQFEALFFEADLTVNTDIEKNIFIEAEPEKVRQLLRIFLDNLVKYSKPSGKGLLRLQSVGRKTVLSVSNECIAVPQSIDHLFDRFYQERNDTSRSRINKDKGYGLGLSIAQAIVAQSNGEIDVHTTENEISFIITWPKARIPKQSK